MDSKEKTRFRASREWKDFRQRLLESEECHCSLCGGKYTGNNKRKLQVHHLDPDDYLNLDPNKFRLLCASDHDLVERISKKILSKKVTLSNLESWYSLLKDVLPVKARIKLESLIDAKNKK